MKIISFEGSIGAGKTSLTNYFSYDLKCKKILEEYNRNPFLKEFYEGSDIKLETEITFLLIHYAQLKNAIKIYKQDFILSDFSIEKDLVYAKLNLNDEELKIFEHVYNYTIEKVGVPYAVIYIDLSLNILKRRIFQRGRPYEMNANPTYFKEYDTKVKEYFKNHIQNKKIHFFNVDDLDIAPDNNKLKQIKNTILEIMKEES